MIENSDLERDGFQIHEACDGIQALAIVPDIHPDIILMDVDMPNMDGLDCTRRLKADPAFSHIPVIILDDRVELTRFTLREGVVTA